MSGDGLLGKAASALVARRHGDTGPSRLGAGVRVNTVYLGLHGCSLGYASFWVEEA